MNSKAQMTMGLGGIIAILVGIIIIVAVMLPVVSNLATPSNIGTSINNTRSTPINTAGTVNATGLNTYIQTYADANVTAFNTIKTANFTATAPATAWIKLYVNGKSTTANYIKAKIINNTYTINDSISSYKITVASNSTAYKNVTYYLILESKYYVTSAPNSSTINLLIYLIPLFIAILALIIISRYMGFF